MRIGLVDVDGHNFPNLALMKLSTYHKRLGDTVKWANSLEQFDKIYMPKFSRSLRTMHSPTNAKILFAVAQVMI